MRKSRRNFKKETTRSPYELEIEDAPEGHPGFITFKDPKALETKSAFDLARTGDPEEQIRLLLSEEDFDVWWAEWGTARIDETNALVEDVLDYYGANAGKRSR
jgi:hypothetical protein